MDPNTLKEEISALNACTSYKAVKFNYVWKIKDLSHIRTRLPLYSPVFSVKGYENIKFRLVIRVKWLDLKDYKPEDYMFEEEGILSGDLILGLHVVSNDHEKANFEYKVSINNKQRCQIAVPMQPIMPDKEYVGMKLCDYCDLDSLLKDFPEEALIIKYKFNVGFQPQTFGVNQLLKCESSKTSLAKDLGKFLDSAEFSDVTFVVENKELKAHKTILASRSQVFAALFRHNMLENTTNHIPITDIKYDVFQQMLRFIYCAEVTQIDTLAAELLEVADKYALENLKTLCELELVRNLCTDTALKTLVLAELHNANQMKTQTMDFIIFHFKDIIKLENWATIMKSHPKILNEILTKVAEK